MPDNYREPALSRGERLIGGLIDWLRKAGARPFANAILWLARLQRRHEPVPARPAGEVRLPAGPFRSVAAADTPALLIFVPRSLKSRLIDGATGGYGYSHLAVDCGEIDEASGRRVMIESMTGQVVHRSFLDEYGARHFVRVPLTGRGFDVEAFALCVKSKLGQAYDNVEALTWGEVDDPAKQICSDLAAVCLPHEVMESIAAVHAAGRLPRRSISVHHRGGSDLHTFVSPNGFAVYFGAPPGERLAGPETLLPPATDGSATRGRSASRLGRDWRSRVGRWTTSLRAGSGSRLGSRVRDGLGLAPASVRAKLIYNPAAGGAGPAGVQLTHLLTELQRWDILPEVHLVTPESQLQAVAADAIRRGIRLIIVAGGDGTIDNAMGALVGKHATLGIIPLGTRNNVAFSLGIPIDDIPGAVRTLLMGRRVRVDVGRAQCAGVSRWFLEAGAVGLASELFPAADELQHGALLRAADLVTGFVSAAPGKISLQMDGGRQVQVDQGHMVVIANMPYIGARFHPVSAAAFDDGRLDVLVFGQLSKLELLGYALQASTGASDDPRATHYLARHVDVQTEPAMLTMVDGVTLGSGRLRVTVHQQALSIMAGVANPAAAPATVSDAAPATPVTDGAPTSGETGAAGPRSAETGSPAGAQPQPETL